MSTIAVIGTGYVGLVTGTCFAELGNDVTCVDVDRDKIAALRQGRLPFFEPSLLELLERNVAAGRLRFAGELGPAIESAEVIFIAVGTPMDSDGRADLQFVESAARQIGAHLNGPKTVVYKSTVPVRTGELIATIISEYNTGAHEAYVVSNPEFLREGSAVADFMQPDRVVVGTEDPKARQIMQALYAPLDAPILFVDVRTAEMIKYTANAFLAMKVSFINEIANICELVGADVKSVGQGIGYDKRIGTLFMNPGIGYGGSCLPKDVSALAHVAAQRDYEATMLQAVMRVNRRQLLWSVNKLEAALGGLRGKAIAVLGLSFKPNTDDTRESPAVGLIRELCNRGATVRAHDPIVRELDRADAPPGFTICASIASAARDADALVLATEWNEYKSIDFAGLRSLMRGNLLFDGRNALEPGRANAAGFHYLGVGRQAPLAASPAAMNVSRL